MRRSTLSAACACAQVATRYTWRPLRPGTCHSQRVGVHLRPLLQFHGAASGGAVQGVRQEAGSKCRLAAFGFDAGTDGPMSSHHCPRGHPPQPTNCLAVCVLSPSSLALMSTAQLSQFCNCRLPCPPRPVAAAPSGRHTRFWEGGKGQRDPNKLHPGDPRRWKVSLVISWRY